MATKALARRRPRRSNPRSRSRRRAGFTLPLAVVGGFMPLGCHALQDFKEGGAIQVGKGVCQRTTGYVVDAGTFHWPSLNQGLWPIVLGILVHKLVGGTLGVNRALARAKVPVLRI